MGIKTDQSLEGSRSREGLGVDNSQTGATNRGAHSDTVPAQDHGLQNFQKGGQAPEKTGLETNARPEPSRTTLQGNPAVLNAKTDNDRVGMLTGSEGT